MSWAISISLILVTNYMLFCGVYGITGNNVRDLRQWEYPFVVSISERFSNGTTDPIDVYIPNLHFCTGAIVSQKSVLTAAHCLRRKHPNRVVIITGSLKRGRKYYAESWKTFNEWNQNQKTQYPMNDIAVITMRGEGIPRINPTPFLMVDNDFLTGKEVRILGWGKMENGKQPTTMRTAWFKVVSNEECSNQGTMLKGSHFNVPPNYFCSQARPWALSSPGDGGAPLLDKHRNMVGINIGVTPKVQGYPQDMLNQLQLNSHLNFYYYKDFLNHSIIK